MGLDAYQLEPARALYHGVGVIPAGRDIPNDHELDVGVELGDQLPEGVSTLRA